MKLLADESLPYPIVLALRGQGFDLISVMEDSPGISDGQVLEIANREGRIVLTMDKDFGDLIYRERRASLGIVLFRMSGIATTEKLKIAVAAIKKHGEELVGGFTVVTPRSVRIRK